MLYCGLAFVGHKPRHSKTAHLETAAAIVLPYLLLAFCNCKHWRGASVSVRVKLYMRTQQAQKLCWVEAEQKFWLAGGRTDVVEVLDRQQTIAQPWQIACPNQV